MTLQEFDAMPDGAAGSKKDVSAARLKSFIQRIEKLEEEKTALGADIREVYGEAKSTGYDPKIMRQVIKLRTIYELLEGVTDRCEDVANIIEGIVLDNS